MSTLILTGAIVTSLQIKRNNPLVRIVDYLSSIRRWIKEPKVDHIIYCDASNCSIPIEIFPDANLEVFSFDGAELAINYAAGKAEAESLRIALESSRFPIKSFYKCTGRNYVKNFNAISQGIESNKSAELYLRRWYRPDWADTRFFWMDRDFFQETVEPRHAELTHEFPIESLFHEFLPHAEELPEPHVVGYSGHVNYMYHEYFTNDEVKESIQILKRFGKEAFMPST